MPRYFAFLRAVSPMNAKMPELKRSFEGAGFTDVKTVLSSGNVAFSARTASEAVLERKAEAAMSKQLCRTFYTIVRSTSRARASRVHATDREDCWVQRDHPYLGHRQEMCCGLT